MAKLIAPLMSFGARGQLGGALVFSNWKGIATARKLVIPANPDTAAQQAQRAFMRTVVGDWRSPTLTADVRMAWNRLATVRSTAVSGFNVFSSNVLKLIQEDPDGSIAVEVSATAAAGLKIDMKNIDDLATGDEAGTFSICYGAKPTEMIYTTGVTIGTGQLTVDISDEFESGDVVYLAVRKAGTGTELYERSGILEITLTA